MMSDIPSSGGLFGALLHKTPWRKLLNRVKFRDMPPYSDDHFVIAVAELEDDDKVGLNGPKKYTPNANLNRQKILPISYDLERARTRRGSAEHRKTGFLHGPHGL